MRKFIQRASLCFALFFCFCYSALAAFCSCTQTEQIPQVVENQVVITEISIEWHYMTNGDCSGTAYNFGSADVYVNGIYQGYYYFSSGFSNPCYSFG